MAASEISILKQFGKLPSQLGEKKKLVFSNRSNLFWLRKVLGESDLVDPRLCNRIVRFSVQTSLDTRLRDSTSLRSSQGPSRQN